jgi:hypothetical protein
VAAGRSRASDKAAQSFKSLISDLRESGKKRASLGNQK